MYHTWMVWVRLAAQPFVDSKLCLVSPLDGAMDVYTVQKHISMSPSSSVHWPLVKWPLMHQEACNENKAASLRFWSDTLNGRNPAITNRIWANISLAAVHQPSQWAWTLRTTKKRKRRKRLVSPQGGDFATTRKVGLLAKLRMVGLKATYPTSSQHFWKMIVLPFSPRWDLLVPLNRHHMDDYLRTPSFSTSHFPTCWCNNQNPHLLLISWASLNVLVCMGFHPGVQ